MEIFIPSNKFIEAKDSLEFIPRIKGRFRLEVRSASGILNRFAEFDNLITNGGMDFLGSSSENTFMAYASVGTGTTAPAFTDTSLGSFVASTNSGSGSVTNSGTPDYIATAQSVYTFTLGAVVGNMTEVGIGSANNGTSLWAKQLILDEFGNPTSFPVLVTEQLVLYYYVSIYPPLTDAVGTVSVGGVLRDYVARPANVSGTNAWVPPYIGNTVTFPTFASGIYLNSAAYSGTLGAVTSTPSTPLATVSDFSNSSYTSTNYYRDGSLTWSPGSFNGTANSILFARVGTQFQVSYSPGLSKNSDQQLVLPSRLSWARYTP